jgi:uncharacterized repeat protein (TIGR01451 family)
MAFSFVKIAIAQQLTANAGTDVSICLGSSTQIGGSPSASGGTPSYSYSWSPATGLNNTNIPNPTASPSATTIYSLTVADSAGSTASDNIMVNVYPTPVVNAGPDVTICQGMCVNLSVSANGGAPFTYLWSNGLGAMSSFTVCPITTTTYSVTVTNSMGCSASDNMTVFVSPALNVSVSLSPDTCHLVNASLCANALGGTPPYTYMWNTSPPQTGTCVYGLQSISYALTVVDAAGCNTSGGININNLGISLGISNSTNPNCDMSDGSASISVTGGVSPYSYQWNSIPPQITQNLTNVPAGNYTVTVTDANGCNNAISVNLQNVNCSVIQGTVFNDINNDGVQNNGETGVSGINVNLAPANIYCFTDVNGSYSFSATSGTYTISLSNPPQFYTSSPVSHSVNVTTYGQIYSQNNFALAPSPNINELSVNLWYYTPPRPGFTSNLYLFYKNNGTTVQNGTVKLVFDNHFSFTSSTPNYSSLSNDTLTWNFTNIAPFSQGTITASFTLPTTVSLGTQLTSFATIYPFAGDTLPANNFDTLNEIVVGSYDPNDKAVEPAETGESFFTDGLPLTYTIRFQNTGTADAVNIYVQDTLSQNLNIETFKMIAASHPFTLQMRGNGILTWTFDNIMLPDSNANEPQSHGFIKYSINPLQTLTNQDTIENTAFIYFDFNPPVITNTVKTYLEQILGIRDLSSENNVSVYPNPVNDIATFELSETNGLHCTLFIYNGLSEITYSSVLNDSGNKINCSNWKKGFYFYIICNLEGKIIGKGKMVVQ